MDQPSGPVVQFERRDGRLVPVASYIGLRQELPTGEDLVESVISYFESEPELVRILEPGEAMATLAAEFGKRGAAIEHTLCYPSRV